MGLGLDTGCLILVEDPGVGDKEMLISFTREYHQFVEGPFVWLKRSKRIPYSIQKPASSITC